MRAMPLYATIDAMANFDLKLRKTICTRLKLPSLPETVRDGTNNPTTAEQEWRHRLQKHGNGCLLTKQWPLLTPQSKVLPLESWLFICIPQVDFLN
jgi:hypothetical protein